MLNASGITKTSYMNVNQILANVNLQASVGCVVAQAAGLTEGTRTIVKAGTPVTGNLSTPTVAFTAAVTASTKIGATVGETPVDVNANLSNAVGIVLHDVDVTDGAANATLLIFGFVNKNRIDSVTKAKITADVEKALAGKITFLTV